MDPFLGEIKLVPFGMLPRGWAWCDGQLMSISQNQALFAVIGTTYGGDGITNFALPNLQGVVPTSASQTLPIGTTLGAPTHTLTASEMPAHTHTLSAVAAAGSTNDPTGAYLAQTDPTVGKVYGDPAPPTIAMAAATVATAGGSQPHQNMMPYLTLGYIIALQGIFPSRN